MFEILISSKRKLKKIDKAIKGCWINLIEPTKEEIERLNSIFPLPKEIYVSLKDIDEVPSIEDFGNFIFIIIRLAQKDSNSYKTIPFGIIISKDFLITLCFYKTDITNFLKSKKVTTQKSIDMALQLILLSSRKYLFYLRELSKKIDYVRNQLEKYMKNEEIIKLMDIQKSLVYFNTSLKENEFLVEKLAKKMMFIQNHKKKELIEDIIEENKQALEMIAIYFNIINGMTDAFSSVISNNLNNVMKLLTSITLVLMLPTLVSSIYGMNIKLPFQESPHAFFITMLISLVLSAIGIILLWKKELF